MILNRLRCRSDFRLSDFDAELKKIGAAMQATLKKKVKNEGVPGDQQGRNILGVVFDRQGVQARSVPSQPYQTRVREVYGVNRPTVRCNRSNCFTWRQARRLVPETER